jgi:hypothetical protein
VVAWIEPFGYLNPVTLDYADGNCPGMGHPVLFHKKEALASFIYYGKQGCD